MVNDYGYLASLFRNEINEALRTDNFNIVQNPLGFIAYVRSKNWGEVTIEKVIQGNRYFFKTSVEVQPRGCNAFNVMGQGSSLAESIKDASDIYFHVKTHGTLPPKKDVILC